MDEPCEVVGNEYAHFSEVVVAATHVVERHETALNDQLPLLQVPVMLPLWPAVNVSGDADIRSGAASSLYWQAP